MRKCRTCERELEDSAFQMVAGRWYLNHCKKCELKKSSDRRRAKIAADPDAHRAYVKRLRDRPEHEKDAALAESRRRRSKTQEDFKRDRREYKSRPENLARAAAQKREKFKNNPDAAMHAVVKKYGIVPSEYRRLESDQAFVCAICESQETRADSRFGLISKLAVDHCHHTGVVRGLLCSKCNMGIGALQDRPDLLRRAADYLEEPLKFTQDIERFLEGDDLLKFQELVEQAKRRIECSEEAADGANAGPPDNPASPPNVH